MNSNCSCCPETLNSGQNQRFFAPCDLEIQRMTLKHNRDPILCYIKLCALFQTIGEFKLKLQSGNAQFGPKWAIFFPCDLESWWITLKNNRAPLLCCFKLCASFHSHRWIQTKVTVRKRSIRVKIGDLLSRVTFNFDGWHWKTIGHLFYVASSFMYHFNTIGEIKLKLQSGNAQFGSKSATFRAVWPSNLMDDLEKK